MILHIDMDAFCASIEQAVNPRLKGKPLIVGSRNNRMHTVVCAASYEAKALGIDSGMPSAEAFKICPNLEFVPAEQSKYIWTSEQVFEMIQGYGFQTAYISIDEFQMDITGYSEPRVISQDIQKQIYANFNITASIGIAKNYILAKLASKLNKPNGVVVLTEENLEEVLARTPVRKLCGVGPVTEANLVRTGIETCLDLYRSNLWPQLLSEESFKTQETAEKPKSIGHSYTFPRASENTGFIKAWIRLLSEMVGERLRRQNLLGNTVHLWLNGPQIGNFGAQKTFQQATNDSFEVYQRTLKILAKTGQKMPKIRALGVTCSSLKELDYPLLFKEQKKREDLIKALDKINSRHGEGSIYPAITALTRKMK